MKKKAYSLLASILLMLVSTLTSCEKFALDNASKTSTHDANGNVTVRVQQIQDLVLDDLTKASSTGTKLADVCSRITFAVFDGEDKIENINQTNDNSQFGIAKFSLDEGEYRLAVVAHNGKGNCTISLPDKVKFYNNKLTDTFCYYGRLNVSENGSQFDIKLERAVSAFKLHINDPTLQENLKGIKFYYTGGSSTLNTMTGYGCVNSRQTETFKIEDNEHDFEVFTFPHEDGKTIKMTISLLDADAQPFKTYEKDGIKMAKNEITKANISLDNPDITGGETGKDDDEATGGLTVIDEWGEEHVVYF